MITGTILYCFILVAVVFFIQWMIIGYCFYNIKKQFDEWEKIQETRKIYLNNWLDDLESTLDCINYNLENLNDRVDNLNK